MLDKFGRRSRKRIKKNSRKSRRYSRKRNTRFGGSPIDDVFSEQAEQLDADNLISELTGKSIDDVIKEQTQIKENRNINEILSKQSEEFKQEYIMFQKKLANALKLDEDFIKMLTDLPANKRVIIYILLKYFSSILKDYESNKSKSIKEIIKPYFDHVKEGYIQKNKRKRDQ
jgi:hypothetical protein